MGSPRILRQTGCAGFASAACPHDSAGVRAEPVESRDISNGYGLGIGAGASQNNEHTGYISGICGELK